MTQEVRGSDGLTARERLEARGFTFDEAGNTEEIGYDGRRFSNFEYFEWDWLDAHKPDLVLRCEITGDQMGEAWRAPDGKVWYQSQPYSGPLDEYADATRFVPVNCPKHGLSLLPPQYVADMVDSTRRKAHVMCTDPTPLYRAP